MGRFLSTIVITARIDYVARHDVFNVQGKIPGALDGAAPIQSKMMFVLSG